jgi:hypothetical protein
VAARQEEARIDVQRGHGGPPLQLLLTDESKRQNATITALDFRSPAVRHFRLSIA